MRLNHMIDRLLRLLPARGCPEDRERIAVLEQQRERALEHLNRYTKKFQLLREILGCGDDESVADKARDVINRLRDARSTNEEQAREVIRMRLEVRKIDDECDALRSAISEANARSVCTDPKTLERLQDTCKQLRERNRQLEHERTELQSKVRSLEALAADTPHTYAISEMRDILDAKPGESANAAAQRLRARLAELEAENNLLVHGYDGECGECGTLIQITNDVPSVPAWKRVKELEARLAAIEAPPVCWHCQTILRREPQPTHCESCPPPEECDVEGCHEPGCAAHAADGEVKS